MTIREATPEECAPFAPYETWGAILESGEGQIFLSRDAAGNVFGHSWQCSCSDPRGAAMLYLAARKKARAWSGGRITIHFGPNDTLTREFWQRRGFEPVCVLLQGSV